LPRAANYVLVRTYIAIECGFDESAYLYERSREKWARRTDIEVSLYNPGEYAPQDIKKISLSEPNSSGERAFSVFGVKQWCSSDWQEVYLRVYRIGPRGSTLVISESRPAYLGFEINTRAEPDEAWFEFPAQSIDDGVLTRTVVYHYRVIGAAAERIHPVALTPRDFAEEWLTRSWSEAQRWSDPYGDAELRDWHRKLHAQSITADFAGMWRCEGTSPEYMIQFDDFDRHLGRGYERIGTVVLLVREEADHRFTMVDAGTERWTDCADPVQHPRARPTLFPK
jgi:hypothetical protein